MNRDSYGILLGAGIGISSIVLIFRTHMLLTDVYGSDPYWRQFLLLFVLCGVLFAAYGARGLCRTEPHGGGDSA